MRMRTRAALLAHLTIALCLPWAVQAQVPTTLTFVGELTDNAGVGVTGPVTFLVALYEGEEGTVSQWQETHPDVDVEQGRFLLELGTTDPRLVAKLATTTDPWLAVRVVGQPELSPRVPLTAAPYALVAADAQTLGGLRKDELARASELGQYVTEEELDADFACAQDVAQVCRTGDYAHLQNTPDLRDFLRVTDVSRVCRTGSYTDLLGLDLSVYARADELAPVCRFGATYEALLGAPDPADHPTWAGLADVCQTGQYADLENAPDIAGLAAELHCRSRCATGPSGCHAGVCDGVAETCTNGTELPDGTACTDQDGVGRCIEGRCIGAFCGNEAYGTPLHDCPYLAGYDVACNAQHHCEYTPVDASGWRRWDIWIYVPPGNFRMGAADGEADSEANEFPSHVVSFANGFFIMKFEVVVVQYEACQAEGACPALVGVDYGSGWGINRSSNLRQHHPQNALSYFQFLPYCVWAAPGGRAPSEAEWEYAASGPTHRTFPWGEEEPDCTRAVFDDSPPYAQRPWGCMPCSASGCSGTQIVGSLLGNEGAATPVRPSGASYVGAVDMCGSLFEWAEDCPHTSYSGAPTDGSAWHGGCSANATILRGGSFQHTRKYDRVAYRNYWETQASHEAAGGRCVRPLP
jgi:formylglycine-generating enzyme required for sulfatase activity